MSLPKTTRAGYAFAVLAFTLWGVLALYWNEVRAARSDELLAHRAFWAMCSYVLILSFTGKIRSLFVALRSAKILGSLLVSTLLIASNWFIFVYAIQTDRLLQASFGYFLNPMVNVVFGILFFAEKVSKQQALALGIVALGITVRATDIQDFPWISLWLAGTFGLYAVIRKKIAIEAMLGNATETLIMSPFAFAFMVWLHHRGELLLGLAPLKNSLLLVMAGPVTLVPLLCFAAAARRIPLGTLGQIQYLAPTLQFLLAIFVFKESPTDASWWGFALVWLGLCYASLNGFLRRRTLGSQRGLS